MLYAKLKSSLGTYREYEKYAGQTEITGQTAHKAKVFDYNTLRTMTIH